MKMLVAIEKFTEWRRFKVGKFCLRGYDRYLKDFGVFLRDPDINIELITPQDITQYVALCDKVGYSINSFIPMMEALKQFFRFYKRMGYKVVDPELIIVPRKEYYKPKVATDDEYLRLLKVADEQEVYHIKRKYFIDVLSVKRNRALLMLLWDTGARCGEILSLKTADLNLEKRKIVIKTEKSRGRRPVREIFWTDKTNDAIKDYLRDKLKCKLPLNQDHVFVSLKGWSIGRPLGNTSIHSFLKHWSLEAKLPRIVNAHSFRHHKGHDIIHKGGSGVDVMNILGHANISSSQVYVQMNDKELQDRAKKFLD